jgi:hypothetical protein
MGRTTEAQSLLRHPLIGSRLLLLAADLAKGTRPATCWILPSETIVLRDPPPLAYRTSGWDPEVESESSFRDRAKYAFGVSLDDYISECNRAAESAGLERTPRGLPTEPFDWLVRYQVKGEEQHQIAKIVVATGHRGTTDPDILESKRKSVAQGVQQAAQWVDGPEWKQWLRRGQRGRPRAR